MRTAFLLLGLVTLVGGVGAMAFRRLVHCALSGALAFAGLAGVYLVLGAEFVAFAQVLVYVGAVAVLMLFVVLLTSPRSQATRQPLGRPALLGLGMAVLVFGGVASAVVASSVIQRPTPAAPACSTRLIGKALMTEAVLSLEVLGLLLTVALIGALVLAWREREGEGEGEGSA
jgi:NADH-quinone oxidoreductase subunit J